MTQPPRQFSEGLGSLRGIAASTVVFYHGLMIARLGGIDDPHDLAFDPLSPWLLVQHTLLSIFNGSAAVILFFVLSGTVLALSLDREDRLGSGALAAYYLKRAFRLGPLLAIVALVAAGLQYFWFDDTPHPFATSWMNWHFKRDPDWMEVVANMAGFSSTLNSPAWTIFVEIAASIAFPVLYLASRTPGRRAVTLMVLIALALLPLPLRGLNVFAIAFFAGALIPRIGGGFCRGFDTLPGACRVALTVALLLVMGWFQRFYAPAAFVDPVVVLVETLVATFLVTIIYFAPEEAARSRWLRRPAFLYLGEISYGLYLCHFLVLFVLAHAVAPFIPSPLPPASAIVFGLAIGLVTLGLTAPIATLTYHLLERPFQTVGSRLASMARLASIPSHPVEPSPADDTLGTTALRL
ncbi:acyltransferase [Rhizobiaceae bacterium]|nr:acyltransferase [Rhizobiaceae bacterium]